MASPLKMLRVDLIASISVFDGRVYSGYNCIWAAEDVMATKTT